MAQTVTFRSIPRHAVLSQADYEWMQQRLGTPLPIFQITFDANGEVATIAVHAEGSCISIFMLKDIKYEISLPSTIRNYPGGYVRLHRQCVKCGKTRVIDVSAEGARMYKQGFAVLAAFPELSDDEREMLISSICPECWEELT